MALSHATPGRPVDVGPLGAQLAAQRTTALFKSRDLEVIRLVLTAGKSLPAHDVPGEITIHCIEGSLDIGVGGVRVPLEAGELLFLEGGASHDVQARSDATALVTIALQR
jgi:quercetin dioxygenase-like cupin family protein